MSTKFFFAFSAPRVLTFFLSILFYIFVFFIFRNNIFFSPFFIIYSSCMWVIDVVVVDSSSKLLLLQVIHYHSINVFQISSRQSLLTSLLSSLPSSKNFYLTVFFFSCAKIHGVMLLLLLWVGGWVGGVGGGKYVYRFLLSGRSTRKLHINESFTHIIPPALSNSPQ
jgi:hypothetical protein